MRASAQSKARATEKELKELIEAMQAMTKYNEDMRQLEVLMTQSLGKLGSHSKVGTKATQAVGAFVTTNLRLSSNRQAASAAHQEVPSLRAMVVPYT